METVHTHIFCHFPFRFKSYYVVWKPENENNIGRSIKVFKSYYVVWKLSS